MHPNPIYRQESDARSLAFARAEGFGILAATAPDAAPLMSHIPFLLSEDGALAEFHLVRSNPIARLLRGGAMPARLAVVGPHGYISPDWYGIDDQVPTWNYVAVHLLGDIALLPDEALPDLLARQSQEYEERLRPKVPWRIDKMTPEVFERLLRQIVPCKMRLSAIDSTWKLGQNKTAPAREGAARGLAAQAQAPAAHTLAGLMRNPGQDG